MQTNTLNIVLNGSIVQGYSGETILSLARRHGIEIPTMCHDDRLEPFSSCFVCVVEVEGMRGHQPSCSTLLTEGMKIITDSEGIRKSRKMALELMLSNHYADCLGPCKQTCPAGVDVQGYISLIDKGLYHDAVALIKETNPLPAICGRVCVRPCEAACRRNLLDEGTPVGIDYMKRFAADIDLESPHKFRPKVKPPTGKKIAVIGAGPGGLSAAHFLAIEGHHVEIYEAAPKSGGWLRYGIPEYRLPNDILDKEVENITELGVEIHYNQKLGENLSYKDLAEHYDAVILTIGSQKGTGVGCDGDDAINVFSGIDFLKNMEVTGQRYDFRGKTIAVVGGGNTAMDCCRTSKRCNADKVYVIYRRTEKEMPANPIEIHESKLEGVEYMFLTLPKQINKNDNGEVESVTCIRMELGEPDASGRRRPVPVEGSDFEIKVDYILAAIGQKTEVGFLDDMNKNSHLGELKINRWGDIDADRDTLQTGIPSVFAAGDGVTGPATIIEAIAQAKKASISAHQYVMGLPVKPAEKPFTSRKDNLKAQEKNDYSGRFAMQLREEMPTLASSERNNFKEVELGYQNETIAKNESQRCLECGCTAFFNCDLQKYASEYQASQNAFEGEFIEYQVDFRHPLIEIDNNKCILCARCIRICREVVGANALGLVNRGLKTYVAPGMGSSLLDSSCESCGLCISTCPTGAITENVPFKPGPVIADKQQSICNYCSVGCTIEIQRKGHFITGVQGKNGIVNSDGNICRLPKFGYRNRNSIQRITKPMFKENGKFSEISFEKAVDIIVQNIRSVKSDENAFFGGARLTNEELYLIHKLARGGAGTNNIGSFQYLGRGEGYRHNTRLNVPINQIREASAYFIFGSTMSQDHPVISYMVQNRHFTAKTPVYVISTGHLIPQSKVNEQVQVESYYYFLKSVIFYLLNHGLENQLFIKDRTVDFEGYREAVLSEDFTQLVSASGTTEDVVASFAELYNKEINAILIFSEKNISANTSKELRNLAMITGKFGKTASGIVALRESCNSQGVFDMGISPHSGIGGQSLADEQYTNKLFDRWGIAATPPEMTGCLWSALTEGSLKNLFVFGEDPLGCAFDKSFTERALAGRKFLMVQDYFLTETASKADLVLPASFPDEIGGTFTNTQKTIQEFQPGVVRVPAMNSLNQIATLVNRLGLNCSSDPNHIFMEIVPLLPEYRHDEMEKWNFTNGDNDKRHFKYGCDAWAKLFAETVEQPLN